MFFSFLYLEAKAYSREIARKKERRSWNKDLRRRQEPSSQTWLDDDDDDRQSLIWLRKQSETEKRTRQFTQYKQAADENWVQLMKFCKLFTPVSNILNFST